MNKHCKSQPKDKADYIRIKKVLVAKGFERTSNHEHSTFYQKDNIKIQVSKRV
jgi:hypothetical protein